MGEIFVQQKFRPYSMSTATVVHVANCLVFNDKSVCSLYLHYLSMMHREMVLTRLFRFISRDCMWLHLPVTLLPAELRGQGSSGSVASPTSTASSTLPLYTLRTVFTLPAEVSFTTDCAHT